MFVRVENDISTGFVVQPLTAEYDNSRFLNDPEVFNQSETAC